MKISTTWSSSRMATRVSCAPAEMIISLFMETPTARKHRVHLRVLRVFRGLIRDAPHPDIEDEAETRERCDEGGAAVAHERQRDPLYRREAGRHRHVVNHLKREPSDDASHQIRAEAVLGKPGRLERSKDDEKIQAERAQHADEPLLLRQNR